MQKFPVGPVRAFPTSKSGLNAHRLPLQPACALQRWSFRLVVKIFFIFLGALLPFGFSSESVLWRTLIRPREGGGFNINLPSQSISKSSSVKQGRNWWFETQTGLLLLRASTVTVSAVNISNKTSKTLCVKQVVDQRFHSVGFESKIPQEWKFSRYLLAPSCWLKVRRSFKVH